MKTVLKISLGEMKWGLPQTIKVDNGSEFIAKALDSWAMVKES